MCRPDCALIGRTLLALAQTAMCHAFLECDAARVRASIYWVQLVLGSVHSDVRFSLALWDMAAGSPMKARVQLENEETDVDKDESSAVLREIDAVPTDASDSDGDHEQALSSTKALSAAGRRRATGRKGSQSKENAHIGYKVPTPKAQRKRTVARKLAALL